MSGRWGNERVTIRNLRVIRVDKETNSLLVCGAIPGPNGGYVIVRKTNKKVGINGVVVVQATKAKKGKK